MAGETVQSIVLEIGGTSGYRERVLGFVGTTAAELDDSQEEEQK